MAILMLSKTMDYTGKEGLVVFCILVTLAASLIPFWAVQYYLTVDGPCHLYNSSIILDYFRVDHTEFYDTFYIRNFRAYPNWTSHLFFAGLLTVFPGYLAERIFLTGYLIAFAFSLRWLLKSINPDSDFLIVLGIPLALAYHFQMGFYNYSLSYVFFFLALGYLIRNRQNMGFSQMIVMGLLLLILYFTHPIALTLMCVIAGILALIWLRQQYMSGNLKTGFLLILKIGLPFIPPLALLADFLSRKGTALRPSKHSFKTLITEFIENRGLMTMTEMETVWALWIGVLIIGLLVLGLVKTIRKRRLRWTDGFLVFGVITLCIYLFQPRGLAGAGIMKERMQVLPFLMALPWLASFTYPLWVKKGVVLLGSFLGVMLIVARMPHIIEASHLVEEYMTIRDDINDESVVAPISFAHSGVTPDGKQITSRIPLFLHAADYIAVGKPLIMLGNYEANTGNFPLNWRSEINPFRYLSGNKGNIESSPPDVDIQQYREETGVDIDYIILLCFDDKQRTNPVLQGLLTELELNYVLHKTSVYKRALLFKRKDL